jgi:hypothetical protein
MVLSKPDFRMASGQFASAGITCNPDLPEEIVAAHALENELGVCLRPKTFASLGHSNRTGSLFGVGNLKDGAVVTERIVASRVGAVASDEVKKNSRGHFSLLCVSGNGRKQHNQNSQDRT